MNEPTVRVTSSLCRRFQDFPGRWRLVRRNLEHVRANGVTMDPVVVRTAHGFSIECDLTDWVSQYIYVTGTYEEGIPALMQRVVTPGSIVVDVGANIGFYSLLLATLVGAEGQVHAFEPMPHANARLRRHVAMNHLKNVHVYAAAASASEGTARFYLGPRHHTSISSLHPRDGADAIDVRCTTLNRALSEFNRIHLLKIDVEGAEPAVLEGASEVLDRGVPFIIAEVSDSRWPSVLLRRGYRMYHIAWEGLRPVATLDAADLPNQYNALFTLHEM